MKKFSLFLVLLFMSISFASAEVVIYTEFGVQRHPDNSTLNIRAARDLDIDFYGAKIFIPKGEKLVLKCMVENNEPVVYILGNNYNNVEVGGNKIKSNSETIVKVDVNKGIISSVKGNVTILDPSGKSSSLTTESEPIQSSLERESMFENVRSNDNDTDVNSVQATQDVQHVLSPSAPR